ncbi:hypothetical protein FBU30_006015 [Linnemannia zychae]|nr:hypothetical protein FBU30_006015 [Linnemannia zychae]
MSRPPVAIAPSDLLAFSKSSFVSCMDPLDPSFFSLFDSLHPDLPNKELPLRIYIVQQPAPAKHRRSYVEIKDLRALCGRDPATGLAVTSSTAALSDLKDSVLVMRRIPEEGKASPRPAAGTLDLTVGSVACFQSIRGCYGSNSGISGSGDNLKTDEGSSNCGDDSCSSLADEDMLRGHGNIVGRNPSFGADQVTMWMSCNTLEYLNICQGSTSPSSNTSLSSPQTVPGCLDADSTVADFYNTLGDDSGDDDEEDNDDDDDDECHRGVKRPCKPRPFSLTRIDKSSSSNPQSAHDSNQSLPQWFRPLVKDGEIQYEIWVVAFLKPQLLPTANLQTTSGSAGGQSFQQQHDSHWTEAVNELLDSKVLHQFVRSEVANGQIGIDFKQLMTERRSRRKANRRIVH